MKNALPLFLLCAAGLLAGCQQSPSATDQPGQPAAAAEPALRVTDNEAARAAVGRFIQDLPEARLYVLDSAKVVDVQTSYQVLVPRSDWAGRMPSRARFEVNKGTGMVQSLPVK